MTETNRYALMMEALAELKPEIEAAGQTQLAPALPALSEVLVEFGPMPREALFLGVASDGLPVLLNLHDPIPGPLLVVADPGAGKTALLQIVARAAGQMHEAQDVQFGVMTNHPDEWSGFKVIPNNVGIFPIYHNSSQDFILSLASWAHANKNSRQSVLLLLDDLEAASNLDFEARQNLRWLLLRGPARRVWPIVTLNSQRLTQVQTWMEAFHTRVFGQIQEEQITRHLNSQSAELNSLSPGSQFALREGDRWLKFWIPSLD